MRLKRPPVWSVAAVWPILAASVTGAVLLIEKGYEGTPLAYAAYGLFALAAVSLGYAIYTLVYAVPQCKQRVRAWADGHAFTRALLGDFGFRTVALAVGSFVLSIAYGAYNGYLSFAGGFVLWNAALCGYYVLLAFVRGGVLFTGRKRQTDCPLARAKAYRRCGVSLFVLSVALGAAIVQMVLSQKAFTYPGWTIYAAAAYAFYKIIMAIVNIVRARRQDDMTVQAIRTVNLADAAVSILALQTAMLHTFYTAGVSVALFNAVTGSVVGALTVALGVYMTVRGSLCVRDCKREADIGGEV